MQKLSFLGCILSIATLSILEIQGSATAQWTTIPDPPAGLIEQAIAENSTIPFEPAEVTIETVQTPGQKTLLYLIDFHNPHVCGATGCLHVGYIPHETGFQQVLGVYLTDSNIKVSNQLQNGLPCLNFTIPPNDSATWCYDGSKYEIVP